MENQLIPDEIIMNKIYYIRGHKTLLASDLAELYNIETRVLNQSVNRNLKRFPPDYMFQLSENEYSSLTSQFVMSKKGRRGRRVLPFVFTEHGVLMLSSVLNSDRAIDVNIQVMRVFTKIRQMLFDNTEWRLEIEKIKSKINGQDKNMEIVFRYLDELIDRKSEPQQRRRIGYKPDKI